MKQPPQKAVNAREIRSFLLRIFVLLLITGGIFWFGWKSRWARADTQVAVETPDAPHTTAEAPPVTPVTPAAQANIKNPQTGSEAVQRGEGVDRTPEEQTAEPSAKPRRRHRTHKPPVDESTNTDGNSRD